MTNPFLLFLILEEMEGRAASSFDQRPETLSHSSSLSLSDWSEAVVRGLWLVRNRVHPENCLPLVSLCEAA
jgi:hypothetical protein